MKLKSEVLELLKTSSDFVSGQTIADKFSVTRSYIWKIITALKKEGYEIACVTNKGYKLTDRKNIFDTEKIADALKINVRYFSSLPSTNEYAKALKDEDMPALIAAKRQTNGKARHERIFPSDKDGIYMSLALKIRIPNEKTDETADIAVKAVRNIFGGEKRENALFLNGEKLAGVLVEAMRDMDCTEKIIIGIGIYTDKSDADKTSAAIKIASEIMDELHKIEKTAV